MKKILYIGLLAVVAGGCATSQAPLDDAYYWPDKKAGSYATTAPIKSDPVRETPVTPKTPSLEILSAQDTTITVRIKR